MLSALLLITCAATVNVDLAPDQPMDFVYHDDPLIVEFVSDTDFEATIHLSVRRLPEGAPTAVSHGPIRLRAGAPYWWSVTDLPAELGNYEAALRIEPNATTPVQFDILESTWAFVRIARPDKKNGLPVYAVLDKDEPAALVACENAGIRNVQLDATLPDFTARVEEVALRGMMAIAVMDMRKAEQPTERIEALARELPGKILRWELRNASPEGVIAIADALHKAESTAVPASIIGGTSDAETLATSPAGPRLRELVVETDVPRQETLDQVLGVMRYTGVERWRFHAVRLTPPGDGAEMIKALLADLAAGASSVAVFTSQLADGTPKPTYAYVCGLAGRLACREPAGPFAAPEGASALLFRNVQRWFLALWADNGGVSVPVAVGDAEELVLTDAFGNPLPLPEPKDGKITIKTGSDPVYLTGTGGPIIGSTARARIARAARAFAENTSFAEKLPAPLLARARDIASGKQDPTDRIMFHFLLRAFPYLEQEWHAERLTRDVAAPALGNLADLVRAICTLQQETGEPFVDPLSRHLEKCEEYRALYLTGSEARERGDWLLAEVLRLMNEAEALNEAGRSIEANAVANLAEWRAQALDYAAKAAPLVEASEEQLTETPTVVAAAPAPVEAAPPPPPEPEKTVHKVARGENPSLIARKYGVSVDDLFKWNNLTAKSTLHIGDELTIYTGAKPPEAAATPEPAPEPVPAETVETPKPAEPEAAAPQPEPEPTPEAQAEAPASGEKIVHTVKRNEYPYSIAKKYGVSIEGLFKWNNLSKRSTLRVGDQLVIYRNGAGPETPQEPAEADDKKAESSEETPSGKKITHTVARGENPSIIADKYGVQLDDFLKWNNMTRRSRLQVGDKLVVYVPQKRR